MKYNSNIINKFDQFYLKIKYNFMLKMIKVLLYIFNK